MPNAIFREIGGKCPTKKLAMLYFVTFESVAILQVSAYKQLIVVFFYGSENFKLDSARGHSAARRGLGSGRLNEGFHFDSVIAHVEDPKVFGTARCAQDDTIARS